MNLLPSSLPAAIPVRNRGRRSNEGMVLVLTLVFMGLVAALVLHLQFSARMAQQTDARRWQQARLRQALTDEALTRLRELASDDRLDVDHLNKDWMQTRDTLRPDGIATRSRVQDLNRYIDLNNLRLGDDFPGRNMTGPWLAAALTQTGDSAPTERIRALRGWLGDPEAAETYGPDFYQQRRPPYQPPGTWLQSWHELRWVEGFSDTRFEAPDDDEVGLMDFATIIPGPRNRPVPVNLNTASGPVLLVLFGAHRESMVREILALREERPFRATEALQLRLDPTEYQTLRPFIDIRSSHFLVTVRAVENDQSTALRVTAHRDTTGRVHIQQWLW